MTGTKTILTRLNAIALAALFALVLAGCGGGGTTAEEPPPMPTPQETCEGAGGRWNADGSCTSAEELAAEAEAMALAAARKAASDAAMAAAASVAAVADIKDSDPDSYAKAQGAAAAAAAGSKAAQDATTSAGAEIGQEVAENAAGDAAMYAGMVSAAKQAADDKKAADAAKKAANDEARSKEKAIMAESTATPGTDSGAFDDTDSPYTVEIEHTGTAVEVEITDPGMAEDDDPKFTMMDGKYVRDNGKGVTEIVGIYTDIEAPVAVAFAKFEGRDKSGAATMPQKLNARDLDADEDADGDGNKTNDFTALTVKDQVSNIMADGFSSATGAASTQSYAFDDSATDDDDEAFETAGTYNGAAGTYRCNGTSACTVTYDAKGKITTVGGGWIFTPDEGATSDQPDYDYYHYGFWVKKTTDDKGVTTYDAVQTFAGSSLAAATGSVEGTAKYAGGAAGVYARNVYTGDAKVDTTTAGTFTADVSLTAYFEGNDVAANKHNSVKGTINGFVLSGGEDASGWSVDVAAGITSAFALENGTAKGGGAGDGSFSGTFHGADTDDGGTAIGPKSVVGEFNAGFSNGSVAGAYGARRMDDKDN